MASNFFNAVAKLRLPVAAWSKN